MYKKQSDSICSFDLTQVLSRCPNAAAKIIGSASYPNIRGNVEFYKTMRGVLVSAEIYGLPIQAVKACKGRVFAFHIHEGTECRGNYDDPFAAALSHYDAGGCEHPYHAGDMPPLFATNGYALSVFLTDRFSLEEVVGKTVIIHAGIDDFTSQPAGNAGEKIACGKIFSCGVLRK